MTERVEGTVVLDGLIEGNLPPVSDAEEQLRRWASRARQSGLKLHLEIEGESFSLLADAEPIAAGRLGPDPSQCIVESLERLLEIYPPGSPVSVFSTLRSVEYQPSQEIQSIYAVTPDGAVRIKQRTLDAQTTAPPEPISRGDKIKLAIYGLVAAAVVLLITSLFVDYGSVWEGIVARVWPVNVKQLDVDLTTFSPYVAVEKRAAGGGRKIVLTIKRTNAYPTSDERLAKLADRADMSLPERLTLEAIARGYARFEFFDDEGEFLGSVVARIAGLAQTETLELTLAAPPDRRPAAMKMRY